MQNGNSNNTTERVMIRTTWLLFANWKHKHQMNKNYKQRQTTKHNTKQRYGKNEKQRTANKDVICNNIQTKTTNRTSDLKYNQKRRTTVQNNNSNNTAMIITIRTTWLYVRSTRRKKQRQTNVAQQTLNAEQTYGKQNNKQQTKHCM